MKNLMHYFCLLLAILFAASCGNPKGKDQNKDQKPLSLYAELEKNTAVNTLSEDEKEDGWQLLFNGKDFTGWHGYNIDSIPATWSIEDSALTMTKLEAAEGHDIITDKRYKNFAFTAEFKLTPGANSGVIFQVKEDTTYKFPYETGPEFQVIDHEGWTGDKLEDWQICGANYAMYPPKSKPFKPVGEWNRILLVVNGNDVTQILNGEEVVHYEKYSDEWKKLRDSGKWAQYPDYGKYDEGYISLQDHGTKVWYRNVKIKEF